MRPPEEVKADIVRQWLARATQDLDASEALLAADPPILSLKLQSRAAQNYLVLSAEGMSAKA